MLGLIVSVVIAWIVLGIIDRIAHHLGLSLNSWTMSFARTVGVLLVFSMIQPFSSRGEILFYLVLFMVFDHMFCRRSP
ncbi:hypothetical protein KGO95_03880 [Patescibacteria group bacterium]|nr:hypothetical protein [Patescibacteria group bacterium]